MPLWYQIKLLASSCMHVYIPSSGMASILLATKYVSIRVPRAACFSPFHGKCNKSINHVMALYPTSDITNHPDVVGQTGTLLANIIVQGRHNFGFHDRSRASKINVYSVHLYTNINILSVIMLCTCQLHVSLKNHTDYARLDQESEERRL